jgi:hypothetical protein
LAPMLDGCASADFILYFSLAVDMKPILHRLKQFKSPELA